MKNGQLIILTITLLMSCNSDESNENFYQLKEKFHGKYEVISSNSLEPVDLNMDGISSTNLLNENPEILNAGLELRISEDNGNLFEEAWPVEYISMPRGEEFDSTSYHSTYTILYAMHMNGLLCQFDDNFKSINLLGDLQKNSTNKLVSIESITIEEVEIIKVVTIRELYTMNGWITSKIESRYRRFTIIT